MGLRATGGVVGFGLSVAEEKSLSRGVGYKWLDSGRKEIGEGG